MDKSNVNTRSLDGWKRSHRLGELRASHETKEVTLMGWVHRRRDHGGLIFIDLRDREGMTQVVLDPDISKSAHQLGENLRSEFVIALKGVVRKRPEGMINEKLPTGAIEVVVKELKLLNASEPLPFSIDDRSEASEVLRLKYRYLDLRREEMRDRILARVRFVSCVRKALEAEGFLDFETPLLYKSTPEGAREFLVPSRIHPGHFYALPQSPQLFKQVLMVSGFDRYYQIVRCFRDEDLRADRQPEFTQIDCEMSFVEQEEVMQTFEKVIKSAVASFRGETVATGAFPRMTYATAMEEYGVDKPDTRFDLRLKNITDLVAKSDFKVFAEAVSTGGIVNMLVVKGVGDSVSRKDLDEFGEYVKNYGAKGLAWVKKKPGAGTASWQSPIAKFFNDEQVGAIEARGGVAEGDLLLFAAGPFSIAKASLGALRNLLGQKLGLIDQSKLNFLWVSEFPLLERNPDTGKLAACHHPFTHPMPDDLHLLESDPLKVRACAYDLVLNGNEVAGGSVRIHDPEIQSRQFRAIGLSDDEAQSKFGFLLEALKFGAPPHAGIAFGLDRLIMILTGATSIRDVIIFPKTNKGVDLMTEAPTAATIEQLRDLHIRVQKIGGS